MVMVHTAPTAMQGTMAMEACGGCTSGPESIRELVVAMVELAGQMLTAHAYFPVMLAVVLLVQSLMIAVTLRRQVHDSHK
jgi:hypothetical protein